MKYKLLVTDLDDTSLSDDGTMSKENRNAIDRYIAQGGKVALASGRTQNAMFDLIKNLGLESQRHLANNGITVFDIEGYVKTLQHISEEETKKILDYIASKDIESNVYSERAIVHHNSFALMDVMAKYNGDYPVVNGDPYAEKNVFLAYGFMNSDWSRDILMAYESDEVYTFTGNGFVIFAPIGSGKFTGAVGLAEDFGIRPEEIATIGDGGNDIQMIEKSTLGFAVANADKEVKDVANVVLEQTNNDDALAFVINNYLLK